MKINPIKAICKQARRIMLINGPDGSQWIGVPGAFYAVDRGLPLDKHNVCALFDFSEDEARAIRILQEDTGDYRFRRDPIMGEGQPCGRVPLSVNVMGSTYMPLYTSAGMLMITTDKLKPVERRNKTLEFYIRQAPGVTLMLAIYRDMEDVAALIEPVKFSEAEEALQKVHMAYGFDIRLRDTGERTAEDGIDIRQVEMPGIPPKGKGDAGAEDMRNAEEGGEGEEG